MSLLDAYAMFRYWRKHPPPHRVGEMFARARGWEPPHDTPEEAWSQGAMTPEEFFQHFKRTGGRPTETT